MVDVVNIAEKIVFKANWHENEGRIAQISFSHLPYGNKWMTVITTQGDGNLGLEKADAIKKSLEIKPYNVAINSEGAGMVFHGDPKELIVQLSKHRFLTEFEAGMAEDTFKKAKSKAMQYDGQTFGNNITPSVRSNRIGV